ncbi:hypothetical protein BaRGS_00027509 [Batillaria attramentaria]|uniref:Methyltransferase domain-containing protein n=1 Tax=Batillaria attramentaria TaxID=370345 RepID=A0ABD0K1Z8_9CAEN
MNHLDKKEAQGLVAEAEEVLARYVQPELGIELSQKDYDKTAAKYDQYLGALGVTAQRKMASIVKGLYPDPKQRETLRVIDVGAGTGLVGVELQKIGCRHIDALEPSRGMLDVAKQRGIYTNFFCNFMDDKQLPIDENTYDCMTIVGAMGDNHIPCCALHEMIRIIKPGGYIINISRAANIKICSDYIERLEPLMEQLEQEGKWRTINKDVRSDMDFFGTEALIFVHEVL